MLFRNDKMNTFCGTPNYLPPEMIARNGYSNQVIRSKQARRPKLSSQVDIWSLGILIYQLLVGRPPVEGDNPKVGFDKTRNHRSNFILGHNEENSAQRNSYSRAFIRARKGLDLKNSREKPHKKNIVSSSASQLAFRLF